MIGADAVLLICAILSDEELLHFREVADSLGLTSIVEAHDEEEVHRAIKAGARVIGVNNRDLRNFTVDIHNSVRASRTGAEGYYIYFRKWYQDGTGY